MPREDEERDRHFEMFVRTNFLCVAGPNFCDTLNPIEFAHIKHAGMGGCTVPSYGNGVAMCRHHHTGHYCRAWHNIGRENFEAQNKIKVQDIADWLAREFEGDFMLMAEDPPPGVRRRPG